MSQAGVPLSASTPPPPHRRRQVSLEGVLNFSATTPLPSPYEAADALRLYNVILEDSRRANIPLSASTTTTTQTLPGPLIHLFFQHMHEQCPSMPGRDNVLLVVLHALFPPPPPHLYESPSQRYPSAILPRARVWLQPSFSPADRANVYARLQILANDLIQGFFAPLKASGGRTPAVSPLITAHSRTEVEPDHGTNSRLSNLRSLCLQRDDHRCVILKDLDYATQMKWNKGVPGNGRELNDEETCVTEVAHIIPHSLNALDSSGALVRTPPFPSYVSRADTYIGRSPQLRLAYHEPLRPRHQPVTRWHSYRLTHQRADPRKHPPPPLWRPLLVPRACLRKSPPTSPSLLTAINNVPIESPTHLHDPLGPAAPHPAPSAATEHDHHLQRNTREHPSAIAAAARDSSRMLSDNEHEWGWRVC